MPDKRHRVVKFNLFDLRLQLERYTRREYSWAHIAEESGLHGNTVINMARNQAKQVHLETLAKLVDFFQSQGLNITVGDLFVEEEDQS